MTLQYTIEIHIPDDPDGVVVKLSRDGWPLDRNTNALIPALEYVFDSLKVDVEHELTGA